MVLPAGVPAREKAVKRHAPISPQGHVEKPSAVPAFVVCERCPDSRLKTSPWARPCPAAEDRHATPVVVPLGQTHVVREGLYFGKTKDGS